MATTLQAAKCSQMSNPKSGTGQGGDRCVEATLAMIICTHHIGSWTEEQFADPEQVMYKITEAWNSGSDVSRLESGSRIDEYIKQNDTTGKLTVNTVSGFFANVQQIIDRGHIAYTGVNDYRKLRLLGGGNPYQWNPDTQPGPAGHVLLIVGYDNGVIVHDPLRNTVDGQPAEYSVTAFEDAGWQVIGEIMAPSLEPPPTDTTHVIAPGETFWGIAGAVYGDNTLYPILEAANPEMNPRMLHIGAVMVIPPKPADGKVPPTALPPSARQHTIVAGDTFWSLAETYYGDGRQYTKIEAANPGFNSYNLPIGGTLVIPA